MRFITILLGGVLSVTVMAEGAYIVKQQRQLRSLGDKIEEIQSASDLTDGRPASDRADRDRESGNNSRRRAPPPQFAPAMAAIGVALQEAGGLAAVAQTGTGSLPLPVVLASPQAREQLKSFVNAQIVAERTARRQEQMNRAGQVEDQRRAEMTQKLGLSGSTARRFEEILTSADDKRRELTEQARDGQGFNDASRAQMRDLRRTTNDDLKALLGDEKFAQYQELRPDGGRRGGWGGGGPRGAGPTAAAAPPGGGPAPPPGGGVAGP